MKNKHLVLLFLAVLALGILLRLLPVHYRSMFNTRLVKVNKDLVERLILEVPGQPALEIDRVKGKWIGMQTGRTTAVVADTIENILRSIVDIESFEVVKSTKPDTLGFAPDHLIRLRCFQPDGQSETIELGDHGWLNNQPVTFIRLPRHGGIYRVPGNLRVYVARTLDDFRSHIVADFEPNAIWKIGIQRAGAVPVYLTRSDSADRWALAGSGQSISGDSVQAWLHLFERLKTCPFADYFDESMAAELLYAKIFLGLESGRFLTFRIFYAKPPNIPEDLSRSWASRGSGLPPYVLHTSQNPSNFFALPDSNLAVFLLRGLVKLHEPGDHPEADLK